MSTKSRSLIVIFFITFFGCLLGALFTEIFAFILPDDTIIKRFFVDSIRAIKTPDNFGIDLGILKINFDLEFHIGVLSILGILVSWYFLRYFR
ncbi:MAG: hypothetical protein CBD97_01245 [Pelagibacteraceae bacterium TMED237]|nr:hypothetical protein [Candidatus Neomarinimicrobiota bacterium]OUW96620.1 MAG: hypothetical protein CBD97_01245 [Pelagibacteraceae bacterium TMED237]